MMSTMPCLLAAGCVMALTLSHAVASPPNANACPDVANIAQLCNEEDGCTYQAPARNGKKWTGMHPMAVEGDLASVAFDSAYILNNRAQKFVACDYLRNQGVGIRMSLHLDDLAVPEGNGWFNEAQRDGSTLPRCNGPVASRCAFTTPAGNRGEQRR